MVFSPPISQPMDNDILAAIIIGSIVLVLSWVFDRWVNPFLARRQIRKLMQNPDGLHLPNQRQFKYALSFDTNEFAITLVEGTLEPLERFQWSEVHRVTAFKRDLFVVDCICLLIVTADGAGIEIDEEMAG
jgi:hypothetical protein